MLSSEFDDDDDDLITVDALTKFAEQQKAREAAEKAQQEAAALEATEE